MYFLNLGVKGLIAARVVVERGQTDSFAHGALLH